MPKINFKAKTAALPASLVTILAYLPVLTNDFVNRDDLEYVYNNPYIKSLDLTFFKWAFTAFHSSNWHPLTWFSHAMDYAERGLDPDSPRAYNNRAKHT